MTAAEQQKKCRECAIANGGKPSDEFCRTTCLSGQTVEQKTPPPQPRKKIRTA